MNSRHTFLAEPTHKRVVEYTGVKNEGVDPPGNFRSCANQGLAGTDLCQVCSHNVNLPSVATQSGRKVLERPFVTCTQYYRGSRFDESLADGASQITGSTRDYRDSALLPPIRRHHMDIRVSRMAAF